MSKKFESPLSFVIVKKRKYIKELNEEVRIDASTVVILKSELPNHNQLYEDRKLNVLGSEKKQY